MTLISTFVMAAVLDGAGFFRWTAGRLQERAAGSGHRLFHLVLAFSACLTLFLNNDGSILIGTPIVVGLVRQLRLGQRVAFAYLLGACLIASASSAPLGVSNMANLEAMALVGITLAEHTRFVLVPAACGLAVCWLLLRSVLARHLPADLAAAREPGPPPPPPPRHHHHHHRPPGPPHHHHPHRPPPPHHRPEPSREPDFPFMWFAVAVVILVRIGFFFASAAGLPTYTVAMVGAVVLLVANMQRGVADGHAALRRAPWPILAFAFGMDLVVFGLRNAGITGLLAGWLGPAVRGSAAGAAALPGVLAATVSSLLNNHPGLIVSSLTITEIAGLSPTVLRVAYASVVIGSDLGALLTPVGTLASLLWFHILSDRGVRYGWQDYIRVTLAVIPASFLAAVATLAGVALLANR